MRKLHIGCGKRDFGEDWHHIDGGDFSHLHSHDITKLPFEDESVDLIYACHVLEYFDREDAQEMVLPEWKRVLKKNGILRLAVPDFWKMADLYLEECLPLSKFLGPLYGKMKMKDETIYHKTVYDFDDLSSVLLELGFSRVGRYDWRETEHGKFDDHSQVYIPHMQKESGTLISLNVEAIK